MIKIEAKEERYLYNAYHMIKAFYASEEVEQCCKKNQKEDLKLTETDGTSQIFTIDTDHTHCVNDIRRELDRKLYQYLVHRTGKEFAWGMLTGVRPAKLATKAVEQGVEKTEFIKQFQEEYLVSAEKAGLAYDIAVRERDVLSELDYKDGYSLYVGIPFCPSVCSYCSFSSGPIDKWRDQIPAYLDVLCKELTYIGKVSSEKKLNTIYIGGGTPTSLDAEQLDQILTKPSKKSGVVVRVQTFGEFEVFVNNKPLVWERKKARELMAYLVDKRGASATTAEIALALWDDDSKIRSVQTIISSLRKTLRKAGVTDVLVKSRNRTAVDVSKICCDLYEFIDGNVAAVNAYRGEYMSNYSWAEFTNGHLYHQTFHRFEDS